MESNTCRECGSKGKLSKGIVNFHNIQTQDRTKEFEDRLVTCLKCPECGHSWIPEIHQEKEIKVYTGVTVEELYKARHPLNEVKLAKELIDSGKSFVYYTNSPDFVSTVKYYGEKHGYIVEFFLDGESTGDSIEPIFEDFNRSLSMIDALIGDVEESDNANTNDFTINDIVDAVSYGFKYRDESQHDGYVPTGNILQWIIGKRNLINIPKGWDHLTKK